MVDATGTFESVPACHGVLVVEDDADIRETIREVLQEEGYRVETAANGLLGIEALKRIGEPYLVLLDMMMPVLDGNGFLARLRDEPKLAATPVLVVSAVARDQEPGTVGAVRKPIDIDTLLRWVRQYCVMAA